MMVALPRQHNILDFPEPVQRQGKSNEWYTPSCYIEASRAVMGTIDLDPASCEVANRTVKAARYYKKEDDGLTQRWEGNIWLNPPFGKVQNRSGMANWIYKLIDEFDQGNISQAILLTTSKTDIYWFDPLWSYPICFANHYVRFNLPDHLKEPKYPTATHPHGTIFTYLGPNEQKFIETFSQFGRIARAIDTPKPSPVNLTLWNGGEV